MVYIDAFLYGSKRCWISWKLLFKLLHFVTYSVWIQHHLVNNFIVLFQYTDGMIKNFNLEIHEQQRYAIWLSL